MPFSERATYAIQYEKKRGATAAMCAVLALKAGQMQESNFIIDILTGRGMGSHMVRSN